MSNTFLNNSILGKKLVDIKSIDDLNSSADGLEYFIKSSNENTLLAIIEDLRNNGVPYELLNEVRDTVILLYIYFTLLTLLICFL